MKHNKINKPICLSLSLEEEAALFKRYWNKINRRLLIEEILLCQPEIKITNDHVKFVCNYNVMSN